MDAQTQTTHRPRRTTSESVDQNSPAYRVVAKAGGLSKFADDFEFPVSTVHSWLANRNGRGKSGLIPSRTRFSPELGRDASYQEFIIHRGRALKPPVRYVPKDFVWAEPAATEETAL